MTWSAEIRRSCFACADVLGLRILTIRQHDGGTVYAIWPMDGYARELADPPVATSWYSLYHLLWREAACLP